METQYGFGREDFDKTGLPTLEDKYGTTQIADDTLGRDEDEEFERQAPSPMGGNPALATRTLGSGTMKSA